MAEAMARVGGPFSDPDQNPSWPQLFLDKFHDTWEEKLNALLGLLDQRRAHVKSQKVAHAPEAPQPRINPHVEKITHEAAAQTEDGVYHIDDANMEKYMAMVGRVKAGSVENAEPTPTEAPATPALAEPSPNEPAAAEPGATAADDSVLTI